ncbi:hypothetical protein U27_01844 [Candidatus Vecturithrix granuli]|uniref:Peptidase M10 metallopeptidase domain-containing protein n=1 Tax=Vecturithrix granuli TaxID=1499967 RepID=A0A0S6W5W7_VECG1|nr:hypothetical protein U27_01844 [Candidatus Vecturithrix granuli]
MKLRNRSFIYISVLMLTLLLVVTGCSEEYGGNPTNPSSTRGLPADPGDGNFAGKVVGTINENVLAGLKVTIGEKSTTTGLDGTFRLDGVGSGNLAVVLSGSTVYTRTAAVNTANGRSVLLDAIETNSNFSLKFYRELARGNHPNERNMYPTHRWTSTTPPTFYINTNAQATLDGTINQKTIDTVKQVLSEIVPVFSGNYYSALSVKTRYFATLNSFAQIPENSIVVSFDDTLVDIGAYGLTVTDPDFVSSVGTSINKAAHFILDSDQFYKSGTNPTAIALREIIAHELGHGFGYRHASALPTVMYPAEEFGGLYSSFDQIHMAVIYSRPIGNTDIDNDPLPNAKAFGGILQPQIFVDDRANFMKSPELLRQIQTLTRFGMVQEYLTK